jgi:pimeloyl-ACP methyl ester carboxylesterase
MQVPPAAPGRQEGGAAATRLACMPRLPAALCSFAVAAAVLAQPAGAQGLLPPARAASAPPPTCSHCKEKLQTVDALRAALPAAWSLKLEPEPVFGGEMLVVRAGPTDAPPLLLVHGLGQNGFTDWLPVLPQLARRWRVTAVDLPGFGYSTGAAAKLSPTNYARVLDRLIEREGRGPVTVVGHSLGGAVSLRLAHAHPQRVSKLVLVDAAGILHRTAFTKHSAGILTGGEGVPEVLREPFGRLRDLGNVVIERILGSPDPTGVLRDNEPLWGLVLGDRANINAGFALVQEDFSEAVHRTAQPVHILWGEADTIAPLRTGELLARRLPNAQLATLPGVGHVPMDQATNDFLNLLNAALANPPAARKAPPAEDLGDLVCQGQPDRRYSGRYRSVRLEGCTGARLTDLVADRIVVRNSTVQMTGVRVEAADIALDVADSEIVATASDFRGRLAVRADAARLDFAGVLLEAQGFALQALRKSRLVASVSEIRDAFYRGWWHEDRPLENALLDTKAPIETEPLPLPFPRAPASGASR